MPKRDKIRPAPLVVKSDLVTATALTGCAALACLPDRDLQSRLCRSIARTHIGLRGSRAEKLRNIIPLLDKQISAEALEIILLADEYEAVAETWRDILPWGRPVTGFLTGGAHIDTALTAGRGAVLWHCGSGPGSRVALRCLAEAGYPLVSLRAHDHPYSPSRLCQAVLNPIPNRMDNRYLESVVIVHEDNAAEAIETLGVHLAANKLVLVTANGAFSHRHDIPFFGGTLRLGLGAPTLAMLQDAPLIPLFSIARENSGYDVIAETPLIADAPLIGAPETENVQATHQMADQFAEILTPYLKKHPHMWENWFAPDTWASGETPDLHTVRTTGAA